MFFFEHPPDSVSFVREFHNLGLPFLSLSHVYVTQSSLDHQIELH